MPATYTEDGSEHIIKGIGSILEGIRQSAGYNTSPRVQRGYFDQGILGEGRLPAVYYEIALDRDESRTQGENLARGDEGKLPVAVLAVCSSSSGISTELNRLIRDIKRVLQVSSYAWPEWAGGYGIIDGLEFGEIRRSIPEGSSLQAAMILLLISYSERMDVTGA